MKAFYVLGQHLESLPKIAAKYDTLIVNAFLLDSLRYPTLKWIKEIVDDYSSKCKVYASVLWQCDDPISKARDVFDHTGVHGIIFDTEGYNGPSEWEDGNGELNPCTFPVIGQMPYFNKHTAKTFDIIFLESTYTGFHFCDVVKLLVRKFWWGANILPGIWPEAITKKEFERSVWWFEKLFGGYWIYNEDENEIP